MDNKRYTVTPKQTADGIDYVIYDTLLGAEVGFFECEKWAESIAGVMEEEWKEKVNEANRVD